MSRSAAGVRLATVADLPEVVAIYNASIPGRLATADTDVVTVADREAWFTAHDPNRRPLWVATSDGGDVLGWVSLQDFYGRPAYHQTAEISVYVHPDHHGQGVGRLLVDHAMACGPALGVRTLLAFVFGHNQPSLGLFRRAGFEPWGDLAGVAILDGVARDLVILGRRL